MSRREWHRDASAVGVVVGVRDGGLGRDGRRNRRAEGLRAETGGALLLRARPARARPAEFVALTVGGNVAAGAAARGRVVRTAAGWVMRMRVFGLRRVSVRGDDRELVLRRGELVFRTRRRWMMWTVQVLLRYFCRKFHHVWDGWK